MSNASKSTNPMTSTTEPINEEKTLSLDQSSLPTEENSTSPSHTQSHQAITEPQPSVETTQPEFIQAEEVGAEKATESKKVPTFVWWTLGGVGVASLIAAAAGKKSSSAPAPKAVEVPKTPELVKEPEPVKEPEIVVEPEPLKEPDPAVALHSLSGDNVLNYQESQAVLALTGEVQHLPQEAVLQLLLDGKPLEVEISRDGNQISAKVDGALLVNGSQLTLVAHSVEGDILTQSDLNYTVKLTTSEQLSADIDNVTVDNIINLAEQGKPLDVNIKLSGLDADAAANIIVFDNGIEVGRTTANANGVAHVSVDGAKLVSGKLHAQVQAVDRVGNQTDITATHQYAIDTTISTPTLEIKPVTGDDIISRAESKNRALPITLTLGKLDADSSATITLYNNGQVLASTKATQNGDIQLTIDGTKLVESTLIAVVTAEDKAGNRATYQVEKQLTIDTSFPFPSVTIQTIAENGVINQAKSVADQTHDIVVNVHNVKAGTETVVTLKDGNTELGSQTVSQNGDIRFSVAGNQFTSGQISAEFRTTFEGETLAGTPTEKRYTLDTQITQPSVAIVNIAQDNVITALEAKGDVVINANVGKLDADLSRAVITFFDGTTVLGSQTAQAGENSFSVPASRLTAGKVSATIKVTDKVGNVAENHAKETAYTLKTSVAQPMIEIESVAGNNIINLAKSQADQNVVVKLSQLEKDATAEIVLNVAGKTIGTLNNLTQNGTYTLSVKGAELTDTVTATVTARDAYQQTNQHSDIQAITVDTTLNLPTVTLLNVAGDNIISFNELNQPLPLNVRVTGLESDATARVEIYNGTEKVAEFSTAKGENNTFTPQISAGKLKVDGTLSAKIFVSDESGNHTQGETAPLDYTVKTTADKPTVSFVSVADDNVISHAELSKAVPIQLEVSGLAQGTSGTITLKNGNTVLETIAVNANQTYRTTLLGETLKTATLTAQLDVTDKLGNTAQSDMATATYHMDIATDTPTISVLSIAGVAKSTTKTALSRTINGKDATAENVAVVVNVSGLETNGTATVSLQLDGNLLAATQTVNTNGDVTFNVPKEHLASATTKQLTAQISAQDQYNNPPATAQESVEYAIKLNLNQPKVEILSIGEQQTYHLYEHQIGQQRIPVKLNVSGIDSDASGYLTIKLGNLTISSEQPVSNGSTTVYVTGEQLATNDKFSAEVEARDTVGNSATGTHDKDYNVDNFIKIKQIDADFNISYTDLRQAGVVISGKIELNAEVNSGFKYLEPYLNQGDVWRWMDSVTLEFENGEKYTVPVEHHDNDNDVFTEDDNWVTYSLSLTATEWARVGGQAFSITPNRLKDRNGDDLSTSFYLNGNGYKGLFYENGGQFQQLNMNVNPDSSVDVSESGNSNYPFLLAERKPTTLVTGFAGGDDVQAGDKVELNIGGEIYTTTLRDDKTFEIEVLTDHLFKNQSATITATLTPEALGAPIKPAEGHYITTSSITAESSSSGKAGEVPNHGDVPLNELPYFIRSLLFAEKNRYGYLKDKVSGETLTIKYSFADPSNADLQAYMKKYHGQGNEHFTLDRIQAVSEVNKTTIKTALSEFEKYTGLTFEQVDDFLPNGQGINFFLFPFYNPNSNSNLFGYAYEGGNVHLNSLLFQQAADGSPLSIEPRNQGISTVLHEVMHSLGMKHPFEEEEDHHHGHDHIEHGNDEILNAAEDGTMLTLMSYDTDINDYSASLRPFDLATLHYRYGVNKTQRTGDDIYTFKTFNPKSADGDIYIWDGNGVDTFNAANEQNPVYINLTPGSWIYSGEKAKFLVASGIDSVTAEDYFNVKTSPVEIDIPLVERNGKMINPYDYYSNSIGYIFNKLYPAYNFYSKQAFIGYGTVIENAVGSDFDDTLIGNDADNLLEGGKGNDTLIGGNGNDVLNGGEGIDRMEGGKGDDIYFVDNEKDTVIEQAGEGKDTVFSTISLANAINNVEVYRLLGHENLGINASNTLITISSNAEDAVTATGPNTQNIELYGNSGDNRLQAGEGNDILDGGEGADTMIGGKGDDIYYVDNIGDVVVENQEEGIDTIISSIETIRLKQGQSIERIELAEGSHARQVNGYLENTMDVIGNSNDNIFDLYVLGGSVTSIAGKGGVNSYTFMLDLVDTFIERFEETSGSGGLITNPVDQSIIKGFVDLEHNVVSDLHNITGTVMDGTQGILLYEFLDTHSVTLGNSIAEVMVDQNTGHFSFDGLSLGSTTNSTYALLDDNKYIRGILKFDNRGNSEITGIDNEISIISPAAITLPDFKQGIDDFKLSYHTGEIEEANAKILEEIDLQDNQIVHTGHSYAMAKNMIYTTKATLVHFGTNVTHEILANIEVI